MIFFLSCGEQEFLIRIEDAYDRIKEQNGEAVVICPAPLEEIEGMYRKNRLSYWILSDEKQEIFSRFIESSKGEGVAALFVTDKFGEIFFQYIVETIKELPPFEDIVKSLEFIESQCPECEGGL